MPAQTQKEYRLIQDEPWTFLDVRHNPVTGRKLTFLLSDGTQIQVDVTLQQYRDAETVKRLLQEEINAHKSITEL